MAKKKTTRKTTTKGASKSAKPAAKAGGAKAAKAGGAKPAPKRGGSAKARGTSAPSRHAPHARAAGKRAGGDRHTPKKTAKGGKGAAKTPELFAQALDMAQSGFLFDAIQAFKALAGDRKSDMADDAQCNIGLCYLRMHLYNDALDAFEKVITGFPGASIAQVAGASHEHGHTSAKARLGRVHAFLGLADVASARAEAESMREDQESHVVAADGTRRTFAELAAAAVRAAGG